MGYPTIIQLGVLSLGGLVHFYHATSSSLLKSLTSCKNQARKASAREIFMGSNGRRDKEGGD